MFFKLAVRLPAYSGVLAARMADEQDGGRGQGSYDNADERARGAALRGAEAPATGAYLESLNQQLGGEPTFSYAKVPADA